MSIKILVLILIGNIENIIRIQIADSAKLQSLDIDWSNVKKQSESFLNNIGSIVNTDKAKGFFSKIAQWIRSFF